MPYIRQTINTLRARQNGHRFADDNVKRIFLNENVRILIKISLKFVPKGPINNNPALVQIMAWRRSGDKPLSEPMIVSLPTHICVTRPQWVNWRAERMLIKQDTWHHMAPMDHSELTSVIKHTGWRLFYRTIIDKLLEIRVAYVRIIPFQHYMHDLLFSIPFIIQFIYKKTIITGTWCNLFLIIFQLLHLFQIHHS